MAESHRGLCFLPVCIAAGSSVLCHCLQLQRHVSTGIPIVALLDQSHVMLCSYVEFSIYNDADCALNNTQNIRHNPPSLPFLTLLSYRANYLFQFCSRFLPSCPQLPQRFIFPLKLITEFPHSQNHLLPIQAPCSTKRQATNRSSTPASSSPTGSAQSRAVRAITPPSLYHHLYPPQAAKHMPHTYP
jgi:hypothetical protein